MNRTDLTVFAAQLAALSTTADEAMDDEHADRQLLLEGLCRDTARLAEQMTAAATPCDIPDCAEHPTTHADSSQ